MTIRRILAALMILAPGFALAQSEGVATFKMIAHGARGDGKTASAGTYRIAFSKTAYRMDMQADISSMEGTRSHGGADAPKTFTMTTISKLSDPDKAYMLNDRSKTYSVIDRAQSREQAVHSNEKWTVKRTGRDTVAGIPCEQATITSSTGSSIETCIATDFLVSNAWWSALSQRRGGNDLWIKSMGDAGLKGFPIRMRYRTARGEDRIDMELVSLDRHGLPAAMFEVPAGYKQTNMMGTMMSPEQLKMMNDAIKNMTPEQRKAYEDAMKKAQ